MVAGEGARKRFFHGGSNHGYKADLMTYVNGEYGCAILTNGDFGTYLAFLILRSVAITYNFPSYKEDYFANMNIANIDPIIYRKFVGIYQITLPGNVVDIRITIENQNELMGIGKVNNDPILPLLRLYPSSKLSYFTLLTGPLIEFIEDGNGNVNSLKTNNLILRRIN
jgi:hypothetical protein